VGSLTSENAIALDGLLWGEVFSALYKGIGLRLSIFYCYQWEMPLNVGLDVSFSVVRNQKEMSYMAEGVNNTKANVTDEGGLPAEFATCVAVVL
jgi:hypothetical protein